MNTNNSAVAATDSIKFSDNCNTEDKHELSLLIEHYVNSIDTLDLTLAEKIWSQEEQSSFIHPRGHHRGWEEIKQEFYLGTMGLLAKRSLKVFDISIGLLSKEAAWSDFNWRFDASLHNGFPIQTEGRETQIWKKENNGWKIVHVHYSNLPTLEEGEGF